MADQETIAVYDNNIESYVEITKTSEPDPTLAAFLGVLSPRSHVLDLGCGPGVASAEMRADGFSVDPVDASREMVRLANKVHDIAARQASFDDITEIDVYDGVWANFSLLHARAEDFSRHLAALHQALKTRGHLHLGMKLGSGMHRDRLGRQYAYYREEELEKLLNQSGFDVVNVQKGEAPGMAGDIEPWIAIIARKKAADEFWSP